MNFNASVGVYGVVSAVSWKHCVWQTLENMFYALLVNSDLKVCVIISCCWVGMSMTLVT